MVEVSKEAYNVCFSSYVKELKNNRKKQDIHEISLEHIDTDEHTIMNLYDKKKRVLEALSKKIMK